MCSTPARGHQRGASAASAALYKRAEVLAAVRQPRVVVLEIRRLRHPARFRQESVHRGEHNTLMTTVRSRNECEYEQSVKLESR